MATLSRIIKLNGVAVVAPAPDGWKVSLSDLDSEGGTGRSETGSAFRDWIAEKVHIDAAWNALTQEEIGPIWRAIRGGKFFPVTYLDPDEGIVTKTFYVSDRSAACYREDPETGEAIWTGLAFQLIEQ